MRRTYDIAGLKGDDAHVSDTSTGTADVQTISAPRDSTGFFLCCETTGLRFTLDGSTPDASNGIPLAAGAAPLFIPIGRRDIKFVAQAAANSVAHVLWLR